jgi:hypothetical protein
MNAHTIIEKITGQAHYEEACQTARRAALDSNNGSAVSFNSDIPHDISNLVWESDLSTQEKLRLILQFYEEMPCYPYLMYLKHNYHTFTLSERTTFWEWVRQQLASEDEAMAPPILYSLWSDFWEDPQTVGEAWASLIIPLPSPKVLEQILIHSGAIPFELKQPLYDQLIHNHEWHYFIYRSLLHSAFDAYGKLDYKATTALLNRLILPPDTEHLDTLRNRLGI